MKTEYITGFIRAKSALHHGGDEKTGCETLFRRMKFIADDELKEIPIVDGNAVRGNLRRLLMQDFIERLGLKKIESVRVYHFLFSGGMLETVGDEGSGVIDLALRKRIRELLPPINLLGSSIGNQALSGKLIVGQVLPVCVELRSYLPADVAKLAKYRVNELMDFSFATRRDDAEREKEREEDEQAHQMMYSVEVYVPGTLFYHRFVLEDCDEVERAVFARILELWRERPYLGGRKATGMGEVDIQYAFDGCSEAYLDFVKKKKRRIIELLEDLK